MRLDLKILRRKRTWESNPMITPEAAPERKPMIRGYIIPPSAKCLESSMLMLAKI
jgi:hypothetical protein